MGKMYLIFMIIERQASFCRRSMMLSDTREDYFRITERRQASYFRQDWKAYEE